MGGNYQVIKQVASMASGYANLPELFEELKHSEIKNPFYRALYQSLEDLSKREGGDELLNLYMLIGLMADGLNKSDFEGISNQVDLFGSNFSFYKGKNELLKRCLIEKKSH